MNEEFETDPVQIELNSWTIGKPLSGPLRKRLLEETDMDRKTDRMRDGLDDDGLWLAWLRS